MDLTPLINQFLIIFLVLFIVTIIIGFLLEWGPDF